MYGVALQHLREVEMSVALERLEIEYVPIGRVNPNAYNPNRQSDRDFELLCRSMEEDGFTQPILVQRVTNVIVDGEHRWRAATILGHKEIPVVFVDMTDVQRRVATLRHNRARGTESIEYVAAMFRDFEKLGALDWAADSLLMDEVELSFLAEQLGHSGALDEQLITRGSNETITTVAVLRQQENEIAERKKAADVAQGIIDSDSILIDFRFAGEEAELMKMVLEPRPIERFWELVTWMRKRG